MGRTYYGIMRDTYIIDPAGMMVKEYKDVNPSKHASQIIKDLQELS